jgi:hypothetical protein
VTRHDVLLSLSGPNRGTARRFHVRPADLIHRDDVRVITATRSHPRRSMGGGSGWTSAFESAVCRFHMAPPA